MKSYSAPREGRRTLAGGQRTNVSATTGCPITIHMHPGEGCRMTRDAINVPEFAFRLPATWRAPLESNHLLLLSPFTEKHSRVTARLAQVRNEFVAALADKVLIAYAQPGSKTEAFAQQLLSWNKPLLTLDDKANNQLVALGASPPAVH